MNHYTATNSAAGTSAGTRTAPPRWVAAVVIAAAVLSAAGATIAWLQPQLLVGPGSETGRAAHVYAGYLISRNTALSVALLTLLALRSYRMLAGTLVFTALVQFLDLSIDAASGRLTLLPGLAVLTAALLAAAARLCPQPLWRAANWQFPGPSRDPKAGSR